MQVQYKNILSLSEYTNLVLAKIWEFPSFSDKCPICGAKNCAVRIGYYWRWVYIFKLKIKLYIPVARYLCRGKNKSKSILKSIHKTFSLLPSQIIPYRLLDADSMLYLTDLRFNKEMCLLDISSEFSAQTEESIIALSTATLLQYLLLFINGTKKLITLFKINFDTIGQWVDYITNYKCTIKGLIQKIYSEHDTFLFGIPSQLKT